MKFIQKLAAAVMVLTLTALLFVVAIFTTSDAEAQVRRNNPVPQFWADPSGTNGFGLSAAAVPQVLYQGTLYTGSTTNVYLTNTFALRIVNGVVVGIIVP
jgi:hypothetical protein